MLRPRPGLSRRDLLRLAAWGAGAGALGAAAACTKKRRASGAPPDAGAAASEPPVPVPKGPLPPGMLAALDALVTRILPAGHGFPSAHDADVARFIDAQLGTPTLAPVAPAVAEGLRLLDDEARRRHQRGFVKLSGDEQDALVGELAHGALPGTTVPQRELFRVLHTLTLEGYLSDPVHGGNRDMVAWKAIGFPTPSRRTRAEAAADPDGGGHHGEP